MEEDKNLIIDEANREAEDYSCPSCGAPIKFSPEKRVLHCDYCGLEINVDGKRSQEENDFLREAKRIAIGVKKPRLFIVIIVVLIML